MNPRAITLLITTIFACSINGDQCCAWTDVCAILDVDVALEHGVFVERFPTIQTLNQTKVDLLSDLTTVPPGYAKDMMIPVRVD